MPASTAPRPFDPTVCRLCGRILEKPSVPAGLPRRYDLTGPVSPSDPSLCLYCETTLITEFSQSALEPDVLSFLAEMVALDGDAEPQTPRLVVVKSRREIPLPATSVAYLGRRDDEHSIQPHIDLTVDGASTDGVSRRHARVHLTRAGTFIEDLASTNGTFINGQRLLPAQLYPLEHGDMLHLGRLKLVVTFSRDPHEQYLSASHQQKNDIKLSVEARETNEAHR